MASKAQTIPREPALSLWNLRRGDSIRMTMGSLAAAGWSIETRYLVKRQVKDREENDI